MNKLIVAGFAVLLSASGARSQAIAGGARGEDRAALEQRFREQAAKLIQQRLGLSDKQMTQLDVSNRKFAPQIAQVAAQERDTRGQLRVEMQSAAPNQAHVNDLLDASIRLQKQRISIVEAEQKDLATFITPVQRARYLALQAQFRNRAQELAKRNGGARGGGGGRRPPGAGHRP